MNHQTERLEELLYIKAQSLIAPIIQKYKASKEKLAAIQAFSRFWDNAVSFHQVKDYSGDDRAFFTDQISDMIRTASLPDGVYDPEKMHLAKLELIDTLTVSIRTTVRQEPEKREANIEKSIEMLGNREKFVETIDRNNRTITIDISDTPKEDFNRNKTKDGKKQSLESLLEQAGEEYSHSVKTREGILPNRTAMALYQSK